MAYTENELKTVNTFSLFLVLVGGIAWLFAIQPYLVDHRYLFQMFGTRQPFVQPMQAILGTIFILLGCILNYVLLRTKRGTATH